MITFPIYDTCLIFRCFAANSGIDITEIELGLAQFLYINVFNDLLNYIQYKLAFTTYICIAFKTKISFYILVMNT